MNKFKRQFNVTKYNGTAHNDEIGYIFSYKNAPKFTRGSEIELHIRRMVKLWANFVRIGNPNGLTSTDLWSTMWLPVATNMVNYLEIGKDLVPGMNPEMKAMQFWDKMYKEARKEEAIVIDNKPGVPGGNATKSGKSSAGTLTSGLCVLGLMVFFSFLG